MLKNIKVRDFQSIVKADIPVGGLTVVVGPTDTGKSALVRAMSAAVYSRKGAACIRHGARQARVSLQFDDGVVLWEREKSIRFILKKADGILSEYTRVGLSVPPEIAEFHRLGGIEAGDVDIKINLANQFDPPFLLTESAPARAKLLSSITGAGFLLQMSALVAKRSRAIAREIKDRRAAKDEADETIERYSAVDKVLPQIKSAQVEADKLRDIHEAIAEIVIATDTVEFLRRGVDVYRQMLEGSEQLPEIWHKIQSQSEMITIGLRLSALNQKISDTQELLDISLPDPGNLEREFSLLDDVIKHAGLIQEINGRQHKAQNIIDKSVDQLVQLEQDKLDMEQKLGVCPLCGNSF